MSAVPKSGSVPLPMMETTKAAEGTRELGVPDGVCDAVPVLVELVDAVLDGDDDAEGVTDGDCDDVWLMESVGVGVIPYELVEVVDADAVGVDDDVRDCVAVVVRVPVAVEDTDGCAGAHATPRNSVLGDALTSGAPPFIHDRFAMENAYNAVGVTAYSVDPSKPIATCDTLVSVAEGT